jgi:hypothetical protein
VCETRASAGRRQCKPGARPGSGRLGRREWRVDPVQRTWRVAEPCHVRSAPWPRTAATPRSSTRSQCTTLRTRKQALPGTSAGPRPVAALEGIPGGARPPPRACRLRSTLLGAYLPWGIRVRSSGFSRASIRSRFPWGDADPRHAVRCSCPAIPIAIGHVLYSPPPPRPRRRARANRPASMETHATLAGPSPSFRRVSPAATQRAAQTFPPLHPAARASLGPGRALLRPALPARTATPPPPSRTGPARTSASG